jgi:hypothetical protein
MFCAKCGAPAPDGAHFCQNCGASLTAPGGVTHQSYPAGQPAPARGGARRAGAGGGAGPAARAGKAQDPYKERITELRLQIRQLKLYLKQANQQMSSTRLGYYETAPFVPPGLLKLGYKFFEDMRLLGPQQQRQQLQQQIMQMEQELLGLQQQQAQWRAQQQQG